MGRESRVTKLRRNRATGEMNYTNSVDHASTCKIQARAQAAGLVLPTVKEAKAGDLIKRGKGFEIRRVGE